MHNFKKILPVILFLIVCLVLNGTLTFLFYPYTYARIDVHNIETKGYDTIFVGSSHGKCGINPQVIDEITQETSINICMGGEYTQDAYFLVKNAARQQMPKRVIYELDPGYWITEPTTDMDYSSFYHEFSWSPVKLEYFHAKMLTADFRITLFPWYACRQYFRKAPDNVKMKLSATYKEYGAVPFENQDQSYENEGFIKRKVTDTPKTEDNLVLWNPDALKSEVVEYFDKLQKFCADHEIELMVITTPIPDVTYEKYQISFDDADDFFTDFMAKRGITYLNFNTITLEGFDRSLDAYADYEGHMYGETANEFSRMLADYL